MYATVCCVYQKYTYSISVISKSNYIPCISGSCELKGGFNPRILTAALLSVLMLKRTVGRKRWIALCVLVAGVMLVQIPKGTTGKTEPAESWQPRG